MEMEFKSSPVGVCVDSFEELETVVQDLKQRVHTITGYPANVIDDRKKDILCFGCWDQATRIGYRELDGQFYIATMCITCAHYAYLDGWTIIDLYD